MYQKWNIRNDYLDWRSRFALIQRIHITWLSGGVTPLAARLQTLIELSFYINMASTVPSWRLQRISESRKITGG